MIRIHVACLGLALAGVTLLAPVPRVLGAAQCIGSLKAGTESLSRIRRSRP